MKMNMETTKALLATEPTTLYQAALGKALGVKAALLIQQIHYWLQTNPNDRDGDRWVFNSYGEWARQLGFSKKTVERLVRRLEEEEIIITTPEYNRRAYDRTKWYTINYRKIEELTKNPDDTMTSGTIQSDDFEDRNLSSPIPKTKPETTKDSPVPLMDRNSRVSSNSNDSGDDIPF